MKVREHLMRYSLVTILFSIAYTSFGQVLENNTTSGLTSSGQTAEILVAEPTVQPKRPIALGAELGANIDLSGTESSCFDIDIYAGYRKGMIQSAGVGVGIHPSFAHRRMFIPVYAMFRCNLKPNKSLCFVDVKAGLSINELTSEKHNTGAYVFGGIGFNLASTRRINTYAILGYSFTQISPFHENNTQYNESGIHAVSIRIGVTF